MTHIDDWLDDPYIDNEDEHYAKWVLEHFRMSAWKQIMYSKFMSQYKLFCTYKPDGKRYRVTGASTLGDIWLTDNYEQSEGYTKRIDIDDCNNWGNAP